MKEVAPIPSLASKRLPLLVMALTLTILGGTILLATTQLRQKIRAQIASRDSAVLHAVAEMQHYEVASEMQELGPVDDLGNQLTVVLKTSRLRGVLGARLYNPEGECLEAFPAQLRAAPLAAAFLPQLLDGKPVSQFHSAARLSHIFVRDTLQNDPPVPLLEVDVPLHSTETRRLIGIAQFIIEGQSIATEYARLDQHLWLQGLAAFAMGGGILALIISFGFRRLQRANRLLAERTQDLLLANQELAMAAKTSAVGAVTSHLIHGLKNPLSGLQNFVANINTSGSGGRDADWQEAVASTRRMQVLINQVVSVLREESVTGTYEITLPELAAIIADRVTPLAREGTVQFITRVEGQAALPNRVANLITLILVNLVQNGVEATPAGKSVGLTLVSSSEGLAAEVRDQGNGFPQDLRRSLFKPCQSTKEGGSGIGLAICHQLAKHLGAELKLKSSTVEGCVFALTVPLVFYEEKPRCTTVTLTG
jgi:signal transduction histidine kinase